ncbi:MAG: hypothetical protein ACRED9_14705 [Caulobacteraceae bacterium]
MFTHGGLFPHGGTPSTSVIGLIVILAVLLVRNAKPRRLRIDRLWLRPLIYVLLVGSTFAAAPPSPTPASIVLMALAAVAGAALGWQRGRIMKIEAHPETHELTMRASVWGMVFILALVALRLGLKSIAAGAGSLAGLSASIITDALIVFAAAMMIARTVEIGLRGRRVLAQSQAAAATRSREGAER